MTDNEGAGKGDTPRRVDWTKWRRNFDRAFPGKPRTNEAFPSPERTGSDDDAGDSRSE